MLGGRFSRRASSDPDQNGFGKKATTVDRAAGEILDQDTGYRRKPDRRFFGRAHGVYFRSGSPPEKG